MRARAGRFAAVTTAVLLLALPAAAQTSGGPVEQSFRRGAMEISVVGGAAPQTTLYNTPPDTHLVIAAVELGWIANNPRGPGPLRGQFEFLVDVKPLFVLHQPARTVGIAASPVFFRWNFSSFDRVVPYVEVAGGVLWTDRSVPLRATSRLNLIEHGGGGVRVAVATRRALLVGYRIQHISNGGRALPNPGVNMSYFYVGFSSVR